MANDLGLKEIRLKGINDTAFVCPTPDQANDYAFRLSQQINDSGIRYNRAIAIARSGLDPAPFLLNAVGLNISMVRTVSYDGTKKSGHIKIIQPLRDKIVGENVLVLDCVIDSGETGEVVLDHVISRQPARVDMAGIYLKPESTLKPRYFVGTTDCWVISHYELPEVIPILRDKMLAQKMTDDEIRCELLAIGPADQVNYFLDRAISTRKASF